MSLMKRMLSSIGIGSAKVDTILQGGQFAPGDTIDAVVKIVGGNTEQQIDALYFSINCTYEAEVEFNGEESDVTRTATLDKFKVSEPVVIRPGEKKEFSLSFQLPFYTPLTIGITKVWIDTGLDIKMAVDPGDKDYIRVVPGYLVNSLFNALDQLGFKLVKAECEAVSFRSQPFVQEFEFRPYSGSFQGRLDELEIVCLVQPDRVEVMMEIDRRARGLGGFFAEMLDMDETRVKFAFTEADIPALRDKLYEIISNRS